MNSTSALSVAVLMSLCTLLGCASFDNDLRDAWRGVPVSIDDVPEAAISPEYRNALRVKGATIEKCGDGDTVRYRIQFSTGELRLIDANGKIVGGVI